MTARYRIKKAEAGEGFMLHLTFADGTSGEVDMEPHLWGPIFEPIKADIELFRSVQVDDDSGTVIWPNGADYAPDVLYDEVVAAGLERNSKRRAG